MLHSQSQVRGEQFLPVKGIVNARDLYPNMDLIDEKWGSMQAYLTGPLGLREADIEKMKARYVK